jgi:large subunit ribosomal protein L35
MPKIKTNRTASKKFAVNKNGKVKRGKAYHSHNTAKKSPKRRRNLVKNTLVDQKDARNIKRMLPYA